MDWVLEDVKELWFILFYILFICVIMTPWLLFFQHVSVWGAHWPDIMAGFALKYSRNRKVRGRGSKTGNQWYLRVHSILSAWTFANEIYKRLKTPSSSAGCIINVLLLTMGISRMNRDSLLKAQTWQQCHVHMLEIWHFSDLTPDPAKQTRHFNKIFRWYVLTEVRETQTNASESCVIPVIF